MELNFLHDVLIPIHGKNALGPAELRVTTVILRQMMLTRSASVCLSYTQLQKLSGLSREGVSTGLRDAIRRKILRKVDGPEENAYSFQVVSKSDYLLMNEEGVDKGGLLVSNSDYSPRSEQSASLTDSVSNSDYSPRSEQSASLTPLLIDINKYSTPNRKNGESSQNPDPPQYPHEIAANLTRQQQDETFERFWSAWPEHVNKRKKRAAQIEWRSLVKTPELAERIVAAVEAQIHGRSWNIKHKKFIPLPATWLIDGGWEDTVIPWTEADDAFSSDLGQENLAVAREMAERKERTGSVFLGIIPDRRNDL